MKAAFIRWAMAKPGIWNGTEARLREQMDDLDTVVGVAWMAWQAAWKARVAAQPVGPPHTLSRAETHR